jgi:hypothetical protein
LDATAKRIIKSLKPKIPKAELPQPTEENQHVLNLVTSTSDNLLLRCRAGTGKTTMFEMIERAIPQQPILYIVFGAKNQKEAKEKMLSTTDPRTFNSIGVQCWQGTMTAKVSLNDKKCREILKTLIENSPKRVRRELWDVYFDVIGAVAMAKSIGYVPQNKWPDAIRLANRTELAAKLDSPPDDLIFELTDEVLNRSIAAAYSGSCDYNDQVYMPALFCGTYPRPDLTFVDEKQDANPVNLQLLKRFGPGRVIGAGDECQNIYGFRGASADAMAEAQAHWEMTECKLSISFRCPEKVVEYARWRAPDFRWIKPGGHVERLPNLGYKDIIENSAIICRNNAPLFKLGMQLLQNGRSVTVAGSDIGPTLKGIMRRLGDDDTPRSRVLGLIEDWRQEKLNNESKSADDIADCMKVFATYGSTLGLAMKYVGHLFAQTGTLKLLTGHKSKGLEFDTVYLLDTWLLKEDLQDQNLRYVMQTRSANELYEVNTQDIK